MNISQPQFVTIDFHVFQIFTRGLYQCFGSMQNQYAKPIAASTAHILNLVFDTNIIKSLSLIIIKLEVSTTFYPLTSTYLLHNGHIHTVLLKLYPIKSKIIESLRLYSASMNYATIRIMYWEDYGSGYREHVQQVGSCYCGSGWDDIFLVWCVFLYIILSSFFRLLVMIKWMLVFGKLYQVVSDELPPLSFPQKFKKILTQNTTPKKSMLSNMKT